MYSPSGKSHHVDYIALIVSCSEIPTLPNSHPVTQPLSIPPVSIPPVSIPHFSTEKKTENWGILKKKTCPRKTIRSTIHCKHSKFTYFHKLF